MASTAAKGSRLLRGPADALIGPEVQGIWSAAFYAFMVTA